MKIATVKPRIEPVGVVDAVGVRRVRVLRREAAVRGCGEARRREHGDTDQSQDEELPAHETGIL